MGAGPAYLFLGHLLLAAPGPHLPPHWRTMCLLPEAESLSRLPALPEPYLLLPTHPPAPQPVGSATTHSPFDASDIPCSRHPMSVPAWIWAPIAPGLSVQKPDAHRTASQAPTSCLACPLPSHPPQLQLQPPCCAPGRRLAGVGGALSPLASPLCITSASIQIPLGSGKGGLSLHIFSRGNNSTSCHMDFCI